MNENNVKEYSVELKPKSGMAMLGVGIGAILNIALDPIFIFVFHLGIKGAAIATIISQFASCIFIVCVLSGKKATLRLNFKYIKPNFKIIGSIIGLGLAPFVMAATESVIGFVLNGRLKYYGDLAGIGLGDLHVSALKRCSKNLILVSSFRPKWRNL